jgi:dihydrolipoamide dehydrogenase
MTYKNRLPYNDQNCFAECGSWVRLYAEKKNGVILGAELIAPYGEHLAHLINWSIGNKLHATDVLSMPFYHPVLEEGLRKAFREAAKNSESIKPKHEMLRCGDAIVGVGAS